MNGPELNKWSLNPDENIWARPRKLLRFSKKVPLVALLRVRNEGLVLSDTLKHLESFADIICAYDDASTDSTREILKNNERVLLVIENNVWKSTIEDRLISETRHRGLLLQEARRHFSFDWCMCCDADERYIGDIRSFVTGPFKEKPNSVRIQLFDAYMTVEDDKPYIPNQELVDFRKFFGVERRDILMLWKNSIDVNFFGLDAREPKVPGQCETKFHCQHYGKSLSYDHWEATCEYYVNHFPWIPYGKKWQERKGKALHSESDFGRPLFRWGKDLFDNAVKIY